MIRQAHTYLVGALSGVVVIGIAIAAFVVLVSAQVFHDLPIPALSSSDQKAASVSQGRAVAGSPDRQAVATTGTGQPDHTAANTNANAANGARTGAAHAQPPVHHRATPVTRTQDATAPAQVVATAPSDSSGTGERGSSASGGNSNGSHHSQPAAAPHPSSSSPSSGSVGGGNATSTSGSAAGGGANGGSSSTSGSSSGAPATGTSGGPATTTPPPTPVTTGKLSEAVTEGVNNAVGTVNEAVGGALGESGVSKVTEEVVKGAAGPESVVGKTVDGVGEVVGGLVGGHGG